MDTNSRLTSHLPLGTNSSESFSGKAISDSPSEEMGQKVFSVSAAVKFVNRTSCGCHYNSFKYYNTPFDCDTY